MAIRAKPNDEGETLNAIVAVTDNWGIGNKGQLLVRNKADMHRFVDLTMGGTVLMGRNTFESFPGGALKGRRNVVLTSRACCEAPGIECVHSMDEAILTVASDDPDKVWLIGGERVYRELLGSCSRAYVTRNHILREADAFFPNLDELPNWQVEATEPGGVTKTGIEFDFVTYRQI